MREARSSEMEIAPNLRQIITKKTGLTHNQRSLLYVFINKLKKRPNKV